MSKKSEEKKERNYRVYVLSRMNGVYQVGRTCYQKELNGRFTRWDATMKGCTERNMEEVVAGSPEEAIQKVINMKF